MQLKLYCDGGSRGNPGPAAYGYVVYDDAGNLLEKCGNYLGVTTNNQAEYRGLIDGLTWVKTHYPDATVEIWMDSLLVVNQVKGLYRVKSPELFPRWQEARGLLLSFPSWSINHTLRGGNTIADRLVNDALDAQS